MPCIVDISASDESKHFETLLCKACKFLTVEQIKSLKNPSGIQDGIEWYSNHLFIDCIHNNDDVLGFSDVLKESKLALKELSRIGFKIINYENGTSELVVCEPNKNVYPY